MAPPVSPLGVVILLALRGLWWLVLIHVVLSWLRNYSRQRWLYHPVVIFVDDLGNAIVRPFRELLSRTGMRTGGLDFSPMMAILALFVAERLVLQLFAR